MIAAQWMWLAGLAAAGGLWQWEEVPPGTDLLARIEPHGLVEEVDAAWWQGRPLLAAHPLVVPLQDLVESRWLGPWQRIQELTGADLGRSGSTVTVAMDLDSPGGPVLSAVARDCFPSDAVAARMPDAEDANLTSFPLDGRQAIYDREAGIGWVRLDAQTLVVGTRRGLQRHMRTLLGKRSEGRDGTDGRGDEAGDRLRTAAARLRQRAPVMVAVALPRRSTKAGTARGPLHGVLESVDSLAIAARPEQLRALVEVRPPDERDRLTGIIRGVVALLRGGAALLEGGGELVLGMGHQGALKQLLPGHLDDEDVEPFVREWLRDFTLESTVRPRGTALVEVVLEPSDYRGLAAASLFWVAQLAAEGLYGREAEMEIALLALRVAERAHRARTGKYLECGPTPRAIPKTATPWPDDACFARLGFRPRSAVRFQFETTVDDGRLMVLCRSDADGDGVPEVWFLNETDGSATNVRALAAGAGTGSREARSVGAKKKGR